MIKKLLAEFLGTMFFLYVILATGDAVAIGLALTVAIMVIGVHSGGHFNPCCISYACQWPVSTQ